MRLCGHLVSRPRLVSNTFFRRSRNRCSSRPEPDSQNTEKKFSASTCRMPALLNLAHLGSWMKGTGKSPDDSPLCKPKGRPRQTFVLKPPARPDRGVAVRRKAGDLHSRRKGTMTRLRWTCCDVLLLHDADEDRRAPNRSAERCDLPEQCHSDLDLFMYFIIVVALLLQDALTKEIEQPRRFQDDP